MTKAKRKGEGSDRPSNNERKHQRKVPEEKKQQIREVSKEEFKHFREKCYSDLQDVKFA